MGPLSRPFCLVHLLKRANLKQLVSYFKKEKLLLQGFIKNFIDTLF